MVKQDQQSRPNVLTNPDRSCTYLVLRATPDETSYEYNQPLSFPEVAPQAARFRPALREALARGGAKIKITLESAEPKGKRLRWQKLKPRLGLAGGVLFKANCQGVPITPNRVRNAKSRNITPV